MTIVVGYNDKAEGRAALSTALAEAQLRGLGVVVVVSDEGERAAAQALLADTPVPVEVRSAADLEPLSDALLMIAETEDVELIVIGLRRRSPVGKLLLGSNAQRILLDAPCPVLAVKADDD